MGKRSQPEKNGSVKTISKAALLKWAVRQQLDSTTKLVLLTLVATADGGGKCRVSLNQLAALTGLSRDSVKRAIGTLDGKLIKRESRRRGNGSTHTSVTTLKVHTAPRARCTQRLGGEVHTAPPIGYLSTNSTREERLVLEDRSHLDNQREYQDERVSEGVVDRWWEQPFADDVDVTCGGLL